MKRTFTILVMLTICVSSYAQQRDTSILKDNTKFLSLQDIDRIMLTPEKKRVISVADWEAFWRVLNGFLLADAIKEYEEKHKAKGK